MRKKIAPLSKKSVRQLYVFSTLLQEMKKIERYRGQYYWRDYPHAPQQYESDADHSWRMAMLVMLLEGKLERPFRVGKAIKLALIHDIAEIITGDASPAGEDGTGELAHAFNKKIKAARSRAERAAARQIFSKLDKSQAKDLFTLWEEYEDQTSFEARIVKALDKIEACLQVLEYLDGKMTQKHYDFLVRYVRLSSCGVDPTLDKIVEHIFSELAARFKEVPRRA